MILDELEDLRSMAYVRAVMSDSVVGWIGSRVPVEVFDAMELTAFLVYRIDWEILKYSSRKNIYPVIENRRTASCGNPPSFSYGDISRNII